MKLEKCKHVVMRTRSRNNSIIQMNMYVTAWYYDKLRILISEIEINLNEIKR